MFYSSFVATNRKGIVEIRLYQEGEEELVSNRSNRQIQEVEDTKGRRK